jgi:hypothetical protein
MAPTFPQEDAVADFADHLWARLSQLCLVYIGIGVGFATAKEAVADRGWEIRRPRGSRWNLCGIWCFGVDGLE